jgi:glutathione S-transferase
MKRYSTLQSDAKEGVIDADEINEFGPTRSIRVRWTLQELGVDFEPIRVNLLAGENRRPEFLKINPAGKIPVLVDGDLVLTESVAIVLYLAEKYSHKGLLPGRLQRTSGGKPLATVRGDGVGAAAVAHLAPHGALSGRTALARRRDPRQRRVQRYGIRAGETHARAAVRRER